MASNVDILHQAVVDRDWVMIDRILKNGDGWKASDDEGESVLHLSFKNKENILDNQQAIIQTLKPFLDEGLSVNKKNASGESVLFSAIENRLRDVVDFLVKCGADINTHDKNGNSIVHFLIKDQSKKYAANCIVDESLESRQNFEQEDIGFMFWLLTKSVNVDCKNNDGKTALHLAIERNLQHVMPILIIYMNDVNHIDEDGRTIIELFFRMKRYMNNRLVPISEYIYKRFYGSRYDINIVKLLLNKGVSVEHVYVHTLLKFYDENPEIIRYMLQRYTKVDARDGDHNTALYLVIDKNWMGQRKENTIDFVRILLAKNANVHLENKIVGNTAVRVAIRVKHFEVLKALLEYGADVSPSTNPGALFLHDISSVPSIEDEMWAPMVDSLVRLGWDVNAVRPDDRFTPLMEACRYSCPAIAQKLTDNGANVNYVEDVNLMGPMHMAVGVSYNKIVATVFKILAKAGANGNVKNVRGETTLHLAWVRPYIALKTLLDLGADVEISDDHGRLPLHKAAEAGNFEGIRALLEFGADVNDEGLLRILNEQKIRGMNDNVNCVMEQWLKLKAANLPVIDGFANFGKKASFQEFYVECLKEVETLKTHHLNDQTTLYALLHMDIRERYFSIANNDSLKNLVESPSLESIFPNYQTLILAHYRKAVARHPLIEPAIRAWYYLTEIELPDICVRQILFHLKNEDLRLMAEGDDEIDSLKRPSQPIYDESAKKKSDDVIDCGFDIA